MSTIPAQRFLLTGRTGQVGWELERCLLSLGDVVACSRQELDLLSPERIRERVREVHPTVIVNAAAYTAVDRAESEPKVAEAVNASAPAVLAEEARRVNAVLIHYSTDYVFDGEKKTPYREDDETAPLGVYGSSKLAGENAVLASGVPCCILRTSWVYGARGRNFFRTIARLAAEGAPLRVVCDQRGSPTWSRWLAEATASILVAGGLLGADFRERFAERSGVYHLSAGGETTWHGFAETIVGGLVTSTAEGEARRTVTPILTSEYPTAAARPPSSVLCTEKVARTWGIHVASWQDQLRLCLADYLEHGPPLPRPE